MRGQNIWDGNDGREEKIDLKGRMGDENEENRRGKDCKGSGIGEGEDGIGDRLE